MAADVTLATRKVSPDLRMRCECYVLILRLDKRTLRLDIWMEI